MTVIVGRKNNRRDNNMRERKMIKVGEMRDAIQGMLPRMMIGTGNGEEEDLGDMTIRMIEHKMANKFLQNRIIEPDFNKIKPIIIFNNKPMHHHNSPHCNPNNKPQKWQPQAQLTDCISANELLQALNTLQQIQTSITPIDGECKENFELSFSQSSYGLFNTGAYATDGNHCMDF